MVAYSGQLSFGHAGFFGVGAYVSALAATKLGVGLAVSIVPAALSGVLLAMLIGLVCVRMQGVYFAVATFAFAAALQVAALYLEKWTNGPLGVFVLRRIDFPVAVAPHTAVYFYLLAAASLAILVNVAIRSSRLDLAFRATRDNEDAAAATGVSIRNTRLIALCCSAFFASGSGAIYSYYITYIDPESAFSLSWSVAPIIYVVFGGIGTLAGPLIGAIALTPLAELLRTQTGSASLLIYGAVLVGAILFMPAGLVGLAARLYRALGRVQRGARNRQS
jgi:branched-chain amino acid transport system permease protein